MIEIKEFLDSYIVAEELSGNTKFSCDKLPYSIIVRKETINYLIISYDKRAEHYIITTQSYRMLYYMMERYRTNGIVVDSVDGVINVIRHLLGVQL